MKRQSKISRSVFQHTVEENKKLLRDIRILSMEPGIKAIQTRIKWRDRFKDGEFNKVMTTCAKRYFKEHPDKLPQLKFKK